MSFSFTSRKSGMFFHVPSYTGNCTLQRTNAHRQYYPFHWWVCIFAILQRNHQQKEAPCSIKHLAGPNAVLPFLQAL